MRRLLLLVSICVACFAATGSASAATTTDVYTFDKTKVGSQTYVKTDNYSQYLPGGWEVAYNYAWQVFPKDGKDGGQCLLMLNNRSMSSSSSLFFYVKKGTAAFNFKSRFDAQPTIVVCKASKGSDNTWTCGDELFKKVLSDLSGSEYAYTVVDIPEDGFYALYGEGSVFLNDITNTYEAAAATYSVAGTVKDADGRPVEGAEVQILSSSVTTAADGTFAVDGLADGEYDMIVSKDGYVSCTTKVTVAGADVAGQDVTLQWLETVVKGQVWDMMNYKPIVGACTVAFRTPDGELVAEAEMDGANYSVLIKGVVLRSYSVKVVSQYYKEASYSYSPKAGVENTRNFVVDYKKISFTLTLKDGVGNPISGAAVSIAREGEDPKAVGESGTAGTYILDKQNAHLYLDYVYTIAIAAEGYEAYTPATFSFNGESYSTGVTLNALTATGISGVVTGTDGAPVAGADVMLFDTNDPFGIPAYATTDDNGAYSISLEGELAASYTLSVSAFSYDEYSQTIDDLARGESRVINVILLKEGEATGINLVTGGTGRDAEIYHINGLRANAKHVDELPAGIYVVNGKKMLVR